MINLIVVAVAIAAYIIGSIPTGYIITRLKGISDIRQHGSGNIGATNVSRVLGLHYFFLIFFLDAGKAFLFIRMIQPYFPEDYMYFFALLILLGNTRSLFLNGSGGKGVATLFGLLAALNFVAVGFLLSVWCASMLLVKTVGIASVIAMISLPLFALIMKQHLFFVFSCIVASWVLWLHRSNVCAYWEKWCKKN